MAHEGSRQGRDRAVTRSKAEKARPPTVPVPQVEIVPGRLTEAEWLALLAVEEGEDVVGDIVADLLDRVLDSAFKVYLSRQCIPFTVSQAREAMLRIIEWRFLARDDGESGVAADPTWGEDEEPSPCAPDSWAQGSVPVEDARSDGEFSKGRGKKSPFGGFSSARGAQEPPQTPASSSTLGDFPGTRSPSEMEPKLEPQAASEGSSSASWSRPLSPGCPSSLAVTRSDSPCSTLNPPDRAEKPGSLGSQASLQDRPCRRGTPGGAGDRQQVGKVDRVCSHSPVRRSRRSVDASLAFPPSQGPRPDASQGSPSLRTAQSVTVLLDVARIPSCRVYPLVQVRDPCSGAPAQKIREKFSASARRADSAPKSRVPCPPRGGFRALASGPRHQLPPLHLRPSSHSIQTITQTPSPALSFLATHRVIPTQGALSPSSKVWPRADWPTGWEGGVELLGQIWAGGHHPHTVTKSPSEVETKDALPWPPAQPGMLVPARQLPWKPIFLPEAATLTPGVTMRNPVTQSLHTAEGPLESDECQALFEEELQPIQTEAPQTQVTMEQLPKNLVPNVLSVLTKGSHPPEP